MADVATRDLAKFLDEYLRIDGVPDYPGAWNGLQVENGGRVTRIAAAVDASERAIAAAAERGCDLLLVHHGLFWDGGVPVTGRRYRKLSRLFHHGIAVYSAHLPLDVHAEVGNNVLLTRALGLEPQGWFGEYRGAPVGCWAPAGLKREVLAARLDELLGNRVRIVAGGPEVVQRVGVVTGGGGSMISDAVAAGLDALITGEGAHHTFFDAEEGGINVFFGGHYATETFGVRALAAHAAERFGLGWEFLELPTGT